MPTSKGSLVASTILTAAVLAGLLALSHGILKWVSLRLDDSLLVGVLRYWPQVGLAMSIYILVFLYYLYALKGIRLGALYPIYTGLSVVLVFALGALRFSEPVTGTNIFGCLLIAVGVAFVAQSS